MKPPSRSRIFTTSLYFVVEKGAEGYRITDIYDESERWKQNSPLYDPGFNRVDLPAEVLDLIDRRCGVWAGDGMRAIRGYNTRVVFFALSLEPIPMG